MNLVETYTKNLKTLSQQQYPPQKTVIPAEQKTNKNNNKEIKLALTCLAVVGAAVVTGISIYKGRSVKLSNIVFKKGKAFTKKGGKFNGTIKDKLANGDLINLEYKNSILVNAKRQGSVNSTKKYWTNGENKFVLITSPNGTKEVNLTQQVNDKLTEFTQNAQKKFNAPFQKALANKSAQESAQIFENELTKKTCEEIKKRQVIEEKFYNNAQIAQDKFNAPFQNALAKKDACGSAEVLFSKKAKCETLIQFDNEGHVINTIRNSKPYEWIDEIYDKKGNLVKRVQTNWRKNIRQKTTYSSNKKITERSEAYTGPVNVRKVFIKENGKYKCVSRQKTGQHIDYYLERKLDSIFMEENSQNINYDLDRRFNLINKLFNEESNQCDTIRQYFKLTNNNSLSNRVRYKDIQTSESLPKKVEHLGNGISRTTVLRNYDIIDFRNNGYYQVGKISGSGFKATTVQRDKKGNIIDIISRYIDNNGDITVVQGKEDDLLDVLSKDEIKKIQKYALSELPKGSFPGTPPPEHEARHLEQWYKNYLSLCKKYGVQDRPLNAICNAENHYYELSARAKGPKAWENYLKEQAERAKYDSDARCMQILRINESQTIRKKENLDAVIHHHEHLNSVKKQCKNLADDIVDSLDDECVSNHCTNVVYA